MQSHAITPLFLVLAIALSWPRFSSIFRGETEAAVATAPLTMLASAVSLSALSLAFAGNVPWFGMVIVALALPLGWGMRTLPPLFAIVIAALSLAAYLQFTPLTLF